MIKNKIKIGFSMVTYNKKADQNYEHDVDFLRKLSQNSEIYLIIERGNVTPNLKLKKIYVQKANSLIFRVLEHFWLVIRLRISGVRVFYSRNSLMNAVIAGIISHLSNGDTFLWSCGEILKGREIIKKEKGYFQYFLEKTSYFLAFKLIKGLVTGTNTMKEYYAKNALISSKKIHVLPNWVDLSRFKIIKKIKANMRKKLLLPSDAFVLFFPRSLSKRHGTLLLPKILFSLRMKGINAYLVVSGKGNLSGWLKEETTQNGTQDYLRLLGGVPNLEMPYLFESSDVCIIPSETEGFPRVILESMAIGIPFVAHSVGGISDIITKKQSELLVPFGALDKFIYVLERTHSDTLWRKEIIKEGKKIVKKFDVTPVVNDFIKLFEKTYIN